MACCSVIFRCARKIAKKKDSSRPVSRCQVNRNVTTDQYFTGFWRQQSSKMGCCKLLQKNMQTYEVLAKLHPNITSLWNNNWPLMQSSRGRWFRPTTNLTAKSNNDPQLQRAAYNRVLLTTSGPPPLCLVCEEGRSLELLLCGNGLSHMPGAGNRVPSRREHAESSHMAARACAHCSPSCWCLRSCENLPFDVRPLLVLGKLSVSTRNVLICFRHPYNIIFAIYYLAWVHSRSHD